MRPTDKAPPSTRSGRSLVTELLMAQLAITAVIGVSALVGLVWISNSVISERLGLWAAQWADELDELGAPFYLSDTSEAVLGVERFVAKYPEIDAVTWYRVDGAPIMSLDDSGVTNAATVALGDEVVAELAGRAGTSPPYLRTEDLDGGRRFRFSGPVWTETIEGDRLLDFDPAEAETSVELLGFVSIELDFSAYRAAFAPRLLIAALVLFALLAAAWIAGRAFLKRALRPLSALQQPLVELADGYRDTALPSSQHSEIQNIVTVLDDTLGALDKREKHLLHIATHDPLTGLYNRHRFIEALDAEIEACRDSDYGSALLFIDLDQFKYVNDTSGHVAGDEMLKAAAQQIRHAVRSDDLVARFGGDEFVAVIRNVTRWEAKAVAMQVLELMRSLTHVAEDRVFHLQCSIGVALIGSGRFNAHELLAQADIACRTAKAHGRNRVEIYNISSKQSEQMERDVRWMREIRQALETNAFELHYQPLLHISTREISHYEALLRLPTARGVVTPDRFLPAAVRFGLMTDIDLWVLARSVRALAEFADDLPELRLSVNLASFVFEGNNLAGRVRALLREHGVSGDRLVLEITEQLALRFVSSTDKQFTMLKDLGCRFAIDDFGTGYSSFGYLKQMPVDYLKIDGSFIKNLVSDRVDQAMVRMVSEVASAARIETVAEYVQTASIFKRLVDYGIDYAQGHYIGEAAPTPSGAVPKALRA